MQINRPFFLTGQKNRTQEDAIDGYSAGWLSSAGIEGTDEFVVIGLEGEHIP